MELIIKLNLSSDHFSNDPQALRNILNKLVNDIDEGNIDLEDWFIHNFKDDEGTTIGSVIIED